MEACWAHNPEVRRSKLRSASYFFFSVHMMCLIQRGRDMAPRSVQVPLAQRIARWTSNPKVLGSIPRWDDRFFVKQLLLYSILTFSFFSLQLYPHPYAGLLSQKVVQNPIYQSKVQFVYLTFTASFRGVAVITSV